MLFAVMEVESAAIRPFEDGKPVAKPNSVRPRDDQTNVEDFSAPQSNGQHKKSRVEAHESPESPEYTRNAWRSTRARVLRSEKERRANELAGQMVEPQKEKTGYQLYHMHRVAEIKEEAGCRHHDAFKKAARDWSRLAVRNCSLHKARHSPFCLFFSSHSIQHVQASEKEWYNKRADKKPISKPTKPEVIYESHAVDEALEHIILQVDMHPSSPEQMQPRDSMSMPGSGSSSVDPYDDPMGVSNAWLCTLCGSGDAGAPEGVCLMCTAFGNVAFN